MRKVISFQDRFDFSKTESQALTVHSIRFAFLTVVFLFTLSFQFLESRIEAEQVFSPLYWLIAFSCLLQISFFSFFKYLYKNKLVNFVLFSFEAFYVTGLIYFIGIQQSILIFLYLVNLILCGVLYQRKGALLLALWTSILFSFIVSLDTTLIGNTAYLAVGVNNFAFFTVAYLSGFLSEQLNFMGERLKEKTKDVRVLKDLNELILNSIQSGLLTVDAENKVLQSNPAAERILGTNQFQLVGESIEYCLPSLDINSVTLDKTFDIQFKKEGEKRILRINVNALRNLSGEIKGKIISFQDETHLRTLEKRVRQSEKMAAIGQLAAGIAHEIRNPLAGISGSIQLMQAGDNDKEQTQKLMGIVGKEIDRLNNLITEFLDFAKPEAPLEDHVDMGNLVSEILDFVKTGEQTKNVATESEIENGLVLLANKNKLRQAFLNIIVNAFQATESKESPKIKVSVKKSGPVVLVSIKDNGIGMSESLKQRIFEPFHTTKHKGTGLGLAITHSILEAHQANLSVDSEEGVGTEFRLEFPLLNP